MRHRVTYFIIVLVVLLGLVLVPRALSAASFVRGDTDGSGTTEITDSIRIFLYLFAGGIDLDCQDAADVDDSGIMEITDGVYLLNYLFLAGSPPSAPFPSCGTDPTEDTLVCESSCAPSGELRSDLARDLSPDVAPGDLAALVAGNTAFALDLYGQVRGQSGNLFFSPHSISEAMAMAYAGAREKTARQMEDTLHFTLGQERLHPAVNALDLELGSRGQGAAGHAGGGFQLRVVNAVWGQDGYPFQGPYLDVMAVSYGAGLRILDFLTDPEACRNTINDWVSAQTADRIQDLLPQGTILPTTRLVLTNAVYFSAAWAQPFPVELTREGTFQLLDGGSVAAEMMSNRWDYPYARGEGWQAVDLPYDGNELSMVILLPDAGRFEEFEASLDAARLGSILGVLHAQDVQVTMPRFRCESSFSLALKLALMGMPDAMAPGAADFSGIDGSKELFISDVLHKAFVAVNEAGTEAAAATAVIIGVVSIPTDMRIDRPFIFLIRDVETGAIVFLGRVVTPAG